MAELQTIAAAFQLSELAVQICAVLRRVRDAKTLAQDAEDRISHLGSVLESVAEALEDHTRISGAEERHENIVRRIDSSIRACRNVLQEIATKFCSHAENLSLTQRFKIAFNQRTLSRLYGEVETHTNALALNLNIFQCHRHNSSDARAEVMLNMLSQLQTQLGNAQQTQSRSPPTTAPVDDADGSQRSAESAVTLLSESIVAAEEAYERFTSQYQPDVRSERQQRDLLSAQSTSPRASTLEPSVVAGSFVAGGSLPRSPSALSLSPEGALSPGLPTASPAPLPADKTPPARFLNRYISGHYSHFRNDVERGRLKQAEASLSEAIRYSEMRERTYHQPFENKVEYQEELAVLYKRQGKWAEAINKVQELIREGGDGDEYLAKSSRARQEQLLGAIYFDRYQNCQTAPHQNDKGDLVKARAHAQTAWEDRDEILSSQEAMADEGAEKGKQQDCLLLLVSILDALGKPIEAEVHREMLQEFGVLSPESITRPSDLEPQAPTDYEMVEASPSLGGRPSSSIGSDVAPELASPNFNIAHRSDGEKVALLLRAVSCDDEAAVHKILASAHGADVNTPGRKGIAAIHVAASKGSHVMIQCLSRYGIDINARDKLGETALTKAVKAGHLRCIKQLGELDADFGLRYDDEGTILHVAIDGQSTRTTALLLDLAPQIRDLVDCQGMTALHHCAEKGFMDQARTLLDHRNRVAINLEDCAKQTALYHAASGPASSSRQALVDLLLEHGATVNQGRQHPRFKDYAALRRCSTHGSVSTQGTADTESSGVSRISSVFSRRRWQR